MLFRDRRFCIEKQIMTSLIQIAISLVYDLGLHKPPSKSQLGIPGDEKPYHSETSRTRTMEERRALLACFLINSTYGSLEECEYHHADIEQDMLFPEAR